jgi:Flp pilus assembly protein TadD
LTACELFIGRPDDAIARLKIAIDLNPNLTWAHGNLGTAQALSGRGDEAVESGIHRLRAACLRQLGRLDEAKAALTDLLRLAPDENVASINAQILMKRPEDLKRYVEALKRAGVRDTN